MSIAAFRLSSEGRVIMEEIDKLFERIDQGQNVDQIRIDIADLIGKSLYSMCDSFGYWEKVHMANAIGLLAWNINASLQHPSANATFWLRLSLVNGEKAFVPHDQRSENGTHVNGRLDAITFDQLLADIISLGAKPSL